MTTSRTSTLPTDHNTVRMQDFVRFYSQGYSNVSDLQSHASGFSQSARVAQAIKGADLDGDGKISGAKEARALFLALDNFDHNGSRNSMSLRSTKGLQSYLSSTQQSFHSGTSTFTPAPGGGSTTTPTQPPEGGSTPEPTHPQPTSPTPTPTPEQPTPTPTDPGALAQLTNPQRFGRSYSGSGPVSVSKVGGRTGAFQYTGGMNVDTDGGTSALSRSDPDYQSQTSMQWAGGRSLDADKIPFIVLPPSLAQGTGAKLGDLVQVKMGNKSTYAIYGDVGPSSKLGEGSLMLAKFLDSRAGPNNSVSGKVTYTVLPGSGAQFGIRQGGPAKTAAQIQAAGEQAFAAARAAGSIR
jgi:hypothetical protein